MILVTGATGKVGRTVVRVLAESGAPVRALVRTEAGAAELRRPGVDVALGDLGVPHTLHAAVSGVHALLILSPPDPRLVEWEGHLVVEARRAGVARLVKLSAIGADERSTARILRWHASAETLVRASGIASTVLRPTVFMQNLLALAPAVRAQSAFFVPAADAQLSFVDARDVGEAAARVLLHDGDGARTYVLSGPEPLSYHDVARELTRVLGRPVHYRPDTADEALARLRAAGVPEWYAEALVELSTVFVGGTSAVVSDAVARLTGRAPRRLGAFVTEHASAFDAA